MVKQKRPICGAVASQDEAFRDAKDFLWGDDQGEAFSRSVDVDGQPESARPKRDLAILGPAFLEGATSESDHQGGVHVPT